MPPKMVPADRGVHLEVTRLEECLIAALAQAAGLDGDEWIRHVLEGGLRRQLDIRLRDELRRRLEEHRE